MHFLSENCPPFHNEKGIEKERGASMTILIKGALAFALVASDIGQIVRCEWVRANVSLLPEWPRECKVGRWAKKRKGKEKSFFSGSWMEPHETLMNHRGGLFHQRQ